MTPSTTDDPAHHDSSTAGPTGHPLAALGAATLIAAGITWGPSRPYVLTLVVLLALIALHELGHLVAARVCGVGAPEFSVGFGPVVWRTRRPDRHGTRYALRAVPLGGFVRIDGLSEAVEGQSDPVAGARSYDDVSAPKRIFISAAGPAANLLVAFLILAGLFGSVGYKEPSLALTPSAGGPAATAGVVEGDVLVSIGAHRLEDWDDTTATIARLEPGEPVTVVVERDGQLLDVTVTPQARTADGRPMLGVSSVLVDADGGTFRAVGFAATTTARLTAQTVTSLGGVVDAFLSAPAQLAGVDDSPDTRLVSPIGAARIADDATSDTGAIGPIVLIAGASAFLAVFNLLPFPPLDGGHIAVAAYEGAASALRRRRVRVNRDRLAPFAMGVVVVVLMLGATSLLLDILRPV